MSEGEDVTNKRQNQKDVRLRLRPTLACLAGLILACLVLVGFTGEARAALWGKSGTISESRCRTYSNTGTSPGSSSYCSASFTPDGSGSSYEVDVEEEDVSVYPLRARLAGGTAYVSPSVWTGVIPVGFALLLAGGLPVTIMVGYVSKVRAQRAGRRRQEIPPGAGLRRR
ncbi:hypothetical protein ACTVZO_00635 [Streptomyces sp. IBSNAI002]|uniref:hypothetical protein n=1 Tax=Streptomyces sp. IBSNAI002 TaxID=3457500 RepID=UPI003FD032A3